jgi:hypothetical protein
MRGNVALLSFAAQSTAGHVPYGYLASGERSLTVNTTPNAPT